MKLLVCVLQATKAAKRAQREGRASETDPDFGRKHCDLCQGQKDLLIRRVEGSGLQKLMSGNNTQVVKPAERKCAEALQRVAEGREHP